MDRDPLDDFPDLLFQSKRHPVQVFGLTKSNSVFSVEPLFTKTTPETFDVCIHLSEKKPKRPRRIHKVAESVVVVREPELAIDVHDTNGDVDGSRHSVQSGGEDESKHSHNSDGEDKTRNSVQSDSEHESQHSSHSVDKHDSRHSNHSDDEPESRHSDHSDDEQKTRNSNHPDGEDLSQNSVHSDDEQKTRNSNHPDEEDESQHSNHSDDEHDSQHSLEAGSICHTESESCSVHSDSELVGQDEEESHPQQSGQTDKAVRPVSGTSELPSKAVQTERREYNESRSEFNDFAQRLEQLRLSLAPGDIQRNPVLMHEYLHRLEMPEEVIPPLRFETNPFVTSRQPRRVHTLVEDVVSGKSKMPLDKESLFRQSLNEADVKLLKESLYESRRLIAALETALMEEKRRKMQNAVRRTDGICQCTATHLKTMPDESNWKHKLDTFQRRLWTGKSSEPVDPNRLRDEAEKAAQKATQLSLHLAKLREPNHADCHVTDRHAVHGCDTCGNDWTHKLAHVQRKQWEAYSRQINSPQNTY